MKKVLLFTLFIFALSLTSCLKTSPEPTITEEPSLIETTTCNMVDCAIVQTDQVVFEVGINLNTIDDSNPVVTVTVDMLAKENIHQILETSSYGELGIIRIRIVSTQDEQIELYSELFDIMVNHAELTVDLDVDDSLTRSLQFARMPFHEVPGEIIRPIGTYKIQIGLYSMGMTWLDTGLLITVQN